MQQKQNEILLGGKQLLLRSIPYCWKKKIVLTDNGCRQLKISKLVRQFIRKGTKYSACKGGGGENTPT